MTTDLIPATFRRRFAAIVIDWWMTLLILAGVGRFISIHPLEQYALFFFEILLLTGLTGSSVGQKILGLRVVDYETGGYVPISKIFVRTVLILLVLPALFSSQGRGYHDIWMKTIIIKY